MNELKLTNKQSLYPVHKQDPDSLTNNEIADIVRWANGHSLSRTDAAKLILFLQAKKKAAYAKKKKQQQ